MIGRFLLLDCDGVIFNSNVLIDKEVQTIEFDASDKHCSILNKMESRCRDQLHELEDERASAEEIEHQKLTIEGICRLREEHFLLKDMVLEEVLEKYVGRIDYDKIFQMHNTFPGVIDKIREIQAAGVFDKIFIVSHYNSAREAAAKERFFAKFLPGVEVILVEFHKDNFIVGDDEKNKLRQRQNKIAVFSARTGIVDLSLSSFIDDTLSIVDEARKFGVGTCVFRSKKDKTTTLLEEIHEKVLYSIGDDTNRSKKKRRRR